GWRWRLRRHGCGPGGHAGGHKAGNGGAYVVNGPGRIRLLRLSRRNTAGQAIALNGGVGELGHARRTVSLVIRHDGAEYPVHTVTQAIAVEQAAVIALAP